MITIESTIMAPVEKVWEYWTKPEHITRWAFASEEWHTPWAKNELRPGGSFTSRMEAKDGTMGFDFGGVYHAVQSNEYIEYTIADGRKVTITFTKQGKATKIVESFEPEKMNSEDMQRRGWQAILDNFKKYTENN